MVDEPSESDETDNTDDPIVKTQISPQSNSAEYELLELIADIDDRDIESLPSFYEQVGHLVEMLFQNPPASEAQMELSFSYAGYRIRLTQLGQVTVLKVKESIEDC